jgi:hypothetical protein
MHHLVVAGGGAALTDDRYRNARATLCGGFLCTTKAAGAQIASLPV